MWPCKQIRHEIYQKKQLFIHQAKIIVRWNNTYYKIEKDKDIINPMHWIKTILIVIFGQYVALRIFFFTIGIP